MNPDRVRIIRNGRVKIDGKWWIPKDHHREYKGELDGCKYLFHRYTSPKPDEQWEPFIAMWGSWEMAQVESETAMRSVKEKHVINGCIYWQWWYPQETK